MFLSRANYASSTKYGGAFGLYPNRLDGSRSERISHYLAAGSFNPRAAEAHTIIVPEGRLYGLLKCPLNV